jgi:hypothetical protein
MKISVNRLIYVTAPVTLYVWALLLWDYTHKGVPVHHFMARSDIPGFSNWWGGLLIPLLTWFLMYRLRQRLNNAGTDQLPRPVIYAFLGALVYAVTLCVFFSLGIEDVPFYMLISLFALSLFFPIYRAEFFLGLVLGMTYTFGGVLPVFIVSVLSAIGAVLYTSARLVMRVITKS